MILVPNHEPEQWQTLPVQRPECPTKTDRFEHPITPFKCDRAKG